MINNNIRAGFLQGFSVTWKIDTLSIPCYPMQLQGMGFRRNRSYDKGLMSSNNDVFQVLL